jgi:CheY-like chemotaxis protein
MTSAKPQVLIVDDDTDIRETLADVLEDRGFSAITAANGLEALELLRKISPPLIVLLDLMMPTMDGYEFLDERAKDPALQAIPVAVLSAGHGVERVRQHATIVPKPVNLLKLVSLLEGLRSEAARRT